jgi:hypothetical protein
MNATKNIATYLGISLAYLMLVSQAAYAGVAGYAQFVNGSVQIISVAGQTRTLQKGEAVNEGDTVISAKAASAQIKMQDGGFVAMRPDTSLKFDSFKFNGKEDGSERSFFSLFKGGFRAVTGLIGRVNKTNYRITTASSTIGIRGTDHETFVVTPDSSLTNTVPVGTYNKVNVGETFMTTDKGTIFVLPNQMGFAGAADQMPELRPLNTDIFTVADRPTKEAKGDKKEGKEEVKEVRENATVDNTAKAEEGAAHAAEIASSTGGGIDTNSTGGGIETNILQPITTTDGIDLTGGGEEPTSAALAAAQAQTAATAAANAASLTATNNATLAAVAQVSTAPATAAIGTATTNIGTVTTAVTTATALPPANATTAATNATAALAAATTASTQATAAQNALNTNSTFADTTAAPANIATQSANTSLQTANTAVQTAAGTVTAQNTALTTAQGSASTALTSANTNLSAANTNLTTANAQNAAIVTAQGSTATQVTVAQTAAANAQTAATAAQAAATLAASFKTAGDLIGAQAQLVIAQQQLAIAQTEQANAQAAQTAVAAQLANAQTAQTAASTAVTVATNAATTAATDAGTASTQATAATTASTNATAALAASSTNLATVNTNAATVSTNAPIAAYNNPAVASSNFMGHLAMPAPAPVTGGYNIGHELNNVPQTNTSFVLDGSGNLVEMRNTSFQIQPMQSTPATSIANADVTWSGGTAADTFKLADNSIYMGRWANATVTVTDLATTPIAPFSLTPANSLWAVLLTPNSGYVQSLVGTTSYTMAGATKPFDAAGIIGTLNTVTLSADFTAQLVNATLNLTMPAASSMAGTYAVTASNMPINTAVSGDSSGFGGNTTPAVSCSGGTGTCAGSGYSANVGGSFAGTAAASAGLGYDIWPTVAAGSPVTDLVQGLVAFNTTTAPTVGTGGPFAAYNSNHIAVETSGGLNFNSGMLAAPADLVYVNGGIADVSTSGALSLMTFRDIGGGVNWIQTSTITGVTAISANASAGIQYGAWTGYTGQSNTWSQSLGGNNGGAPDSWMYGPEGYVDASNGALFAGTSAGTFTYQMDGATAPTSRNTRLTGTLTSASFTVNFASMLLSGNMTLTMPGNENWGAAVTNAPIVLGSPLNVAPVVTYSVGAAALLAACSACSGNVSGMFTGQNLAGAILSYDLYNNAAMGGGDVSGNVALTRVGVSGNTVVANGGAAPTGNIVVATANQNGSVSTYPVTSSTTTGNLLTAFGSSGAGFSNSTTVTCTTCTTNASGDVANSGIYYGNWSAGTYAQAISSTFTAGTLPPSYWITGPEAGPIYLPQALTGMASYTFNAGQVSNSAGVAGTFGTTTLSLDFNKQTVGIILNVTINDLLGAPHTWNAATTTGNEAVLGNGQGVSGAAFSASAFNNGGGSGLLTVTVDTGLTPVTIYNANINGQLTGTGLTGAIMSFNLDGVLNPLTAPTYENINGVAAFTGTAANTATPHQYVSIALADPFSPVPLPVLGFYANAVSTTLPVGVKTDVNGNLTQFDTQIINNNGGGSSSTVTNVSATNADHGTDAVSGISWGCWSGGTFTVTDRKTGAAPTVVTQTLSNSLHWIAEPVATTAVTLPTTGTYIYTNAGGTSPTDNLGNVGILNSATLSANFTAQTVNVGVNATVAGATLNAAGNSVPIIQQTVFYASSQEPAASTSHLAVTCTGSCGATLGGTVIGKFTGAGAIGAAMTYGLQNGATTISGVTAFHR